MSNVDRISLFLSFFIDDISLHICDGEVFFFNLVLILMIHSQLNKKLRDLNSIRKRSFSPISPQGYKMYSSHKSTIRLVLALIPSI